jgi:hypothetical protein
MANPLCLLRLHKWQVKRSEGGDAYKQCVRCGRQGDIPGSGSGWAAGGMGSGGGG